ncbi:hypothetical protein RHO15_02250 [Utexia brackfieldae]|uniref:hypothetical protein n=1 Tax=Utexia brackfieldae TaxID=3074108 RepID=UPI00370D739B
MKKIIKPTRITTALHVAIVLMATTSAATVYAVDNSVSIIGQTSGSISVNNRKPIITENSGINLAGNRVVNINVMNRLAITSDKAGINLSANKVDGDITNINNGAITSGTDGISIDY